MQSGPFGNKVRPGVLQSSILQTNVLQKCQNQKVQATVDVFILSQLFGILVRPMFVERRTGVLKVQPGCVRRIKIPSNIVYSKWSCAFH